MKFIILILMLFTVTANAAKFRYNSTEFGAADNSDIYIYANNDDVAPYPALMYNFANGKWTISNDGVLFYDIIDSSSGSVVGPTSALDNAIARYDLTTGKLIQGSNVLIDDSDNISGINNLTVTGTTTLDTALTGPVKLTAGVLSASSVDLTSEITGVLPIANGGTNSSTILGNDKVIISSAGSLVESATTTTQLGFLDATSSIQTQINSKEDSLPWNANGDMVYFQSAGNIIKIPAGTQDQVLIMGASNNPLWATGATPSPTTTEGDLIVRGATVDERLAAHATSGYVLTSNGSGAAPSYQASVAAASFATVTKTATATLSVVNEDNVIVDATTADFTITLPTASGNSGLTYKISKSTAANAVTIDASTTETIGGELTVVMTSKDDSIIITSDGSNWFYLSDDVVYSLKVRTGSGVTLANGATVIFGDVDKDTHTWYNNLTGVYTPLVEGLYLISSIVSVGGSAGVVGEVFSIQVEVNGTRVDKGTSVTAFDTATRTYTAEVTSIISITSGQTIEIVTNESFSTPLTLTANNDLTHLSIYRIK